MGNEVIFIVSVIALIFYLVISKFLKNNIKDNYFRIFIGLIISIMFGIIFYVFSVPLNQVNAFHIMGNILQLQKCVLNPYYR